jgi:hypothetical protein
MDATEGKDKLPVEFAVLGSVSVETARKHLRLGLARPT